MINSISIYLSIYLSICLSVCLSVYLSIYLSIYLSRKEAIKSMVALLGSNKLDLFGGTKLIVTFIVHKKSSWFEIDHV